MSDITERDIDDRRLVLVFEPQIKWDQLLGIYKLQINKGKEQAKAVCNCLVECDLLSKIEDMCSDTTASNTGKLFFVYFFFHINYFPLLRT